MRRGALTLLALLVALAPAVGSATAAAPKQPKLRGAAPTGPLVNEGRWTVDQRGRVAILHGINMVYKLPPYEPQAVGFGADDARFLRRNGFNTVRLGLVYGAVEPQPGRYDNAYVKRSGRLARTLHRQGIFSMLDFHQDLYNERFSGEGWPGWATIDDGLPAEPLAGFPGSYITSPGLNRAFDNFWANADGPGGVALQRRYARAWARVTRLVGNGRGVMGYDLLNEPWPGTDFSSCANTEGCPVHDREELAPFYRRVIAAIREAGGRRTIYYEPHVLFNFGSDTNLPDLNGGGERNLGFSFHDYCLTGLIAGAPSSCEELDELVFDNADAHAARTGDVPILTEFGATDDIEVLDRVTRYADDHMVSWQEWHYCGCDDPTTQGPGDVQALVKDPSKSPRGDNVFRDKLKALARPYPQAVAGTPRRWSFDPGTGRFELVYTRRRADGTGRFRRGRTLVFLPRIHYPDGYRAQVQGGSIRSGPRRLVVRADRGSKRIELRVAPR